MYEELVKKLRFCVGAITCNRCEWRENCYPGLPEKQAADAMESMNKAYQMMAEAYEAEATKRDWIPVTERLPMIGKKAICFGKNGYMIGTYGEFGWMFPCYFGNVTHWMPLPEAPEEDK